MPESLPLTDPVWIFALLMLAILAAPAIAQRLRIPPIVGVILAGTLLGPNALGVLERAGMVATLGTAGLLYIMFLAGLELDLNEVSEQRRGSMIFGIATFVLPMAIGTGVILLMGFSPLASLLLASCWASHTLLSYPIFRRFGVVSNRAVATSVGATIVTDTAALIVLVIVARAYVGDLTIWFWPSVTAGLVGLGLFTLVLLPRVTRWYFRVVGPDRNARLTFLLLALFASGVVAQIAGIEAIIGAFFAGLAMNRLVPRHSLLMERVEVLGSALLLPLFLLSVGMLVDPRLLVDLGVLGTAAGFIAVALGAKWLAAALAGRVLGYDRAERAAMFSLSSAQAAATLAAVFIGLEIGLIDAQTVNAVIVVILVTCLASSVVGGRAAPRLTAPTVAPPLGTSIVVPIARPESAGALARLAAALARPDAGLVVPITVARPDADPDTIGRIRRTTARAEAVAQAAGVEARGISRVDVDPVTGILNAARQEAASLLVVGWSDVLGGRLRFGPVLDQLIDRSPLPTIVARLDDVIWRRVLLIVDSATLEPGHHSSLQLAAHVVDRMRRDGRLDAVIVASPETTDGLALVPMLRDCPVDVAERPLHHANTVVRPDDLVVLVGRPDPQQLRAELGRSLRVLREPGNLLIAIGHRSSLEVPTEPDRPPSTGESLEVR